jgi:hypothetical protein
MIRGGDTASSTAAWIAAFPSTPVIIIAVMVLFKNESFFDLVDYLCDTYDLSRPQLVVAGFVFLLTCTAIIRVIMWYVDTYSERTAMANETYQIEKQALIRFFESTNGTRWKDKTRWCSEEPLYKWKGVKVCPRTHRVNKLILPENNLSGVLPGDAFDALAALIEIDLRDNDIGGELPQEMCTLSQLGGLYLYSNRFEGDVPLALSKLPKLRGIYLMNNYFNNVLAVREHFKREVHSECFVYI